MEHLIAEHGEGVDVMRLIKRALDPDNLTNPGKMVRIERHWRRNTSAAGATGGPGPCLNGSGNSVNRRPEPEMTIADAIPLRPCALFAALLALLFAPSKAAAQDLFEIQIYPYETVEPHRTMVEFHLNYIPVGTKDTENGRYANDGQFHFTTELTRGLTPHWELGWYLVTAYVPGVGPKFAGTRIRPRVRLPRSWHLPFGVSISVELAFHKRAFESNTITLEIRPIIEKEAGRWYFSVNPDLTKSFRGESAHVGFGMEPGVKVAYSVTKVVAAGLEYYAETGPIAHFDPLRAQHHLIFPTLDLNVSPDWELNVAVGRGLTAASEHWIVKAIVGYRFKF